MGGRVRPPTRGSRRGCGCARIQPPPIPEVSDWTICAAPKIRATPITTEKHQDQGMREVKAKKPTAATATVAAVVANVPVMNVKTAGQSRVQRLERRASRPGCVRTRQYREITSAAITQASFDRLTRFIDRLLPRQNPRKEPNRRSIPGLWMTRGSKPARARLPTAPNHSLRLSARSSRGEPTARRARNIGW